MGITEFAPYTHYIELLMESRHESFYPRDGYYDVLMNRRDVLRAAAGGLSLTLATSTAGCMGLFENTDDSVGPVPVADPRTSTDEELPPDVQASKEKLNTAQSELSAAIRSIEGELREFDGVLQTSSESRGTVSMDAQEIREHATAASEALTDAGDGATEGQQLLVEELNNVVTGFEETANLIEALSQTVVAFAAWETAVKEVDIQAAETAFEEFTSHISTARDALGTAQSAFSGVSKSVLENADELSPGRIDRMFIELSEGIAYLSIMDSGLTDIVAGVPAVGTVIEHAEQEEYGAAKNALTDVEDAFKEAYGTFNGEDQSVAVRFQQDIQAMQCVTGRTANATVYFRDALQAYQNGNQSAVISNVMTAQEELDSCSYGLVNQAFDVIVEKILNNA